jgi:hypothetical protein
MKKEQHRHFTPNPKRINQFPKGDFQAFQIKQMVSLIQICLHPKAEQSRIILELVVKFP